jgi:hypothetical protein
VTGIALDVPRTTFVRPDHSLPIKISAVPETDGLSLSAIFSDITNHARIPTYPLNFVGIIEGQKLDAAVVDGQPDLNLYQLARFL